LPRCIAAASSLAAKEAVIKATALDVGATGRDDTSGYGLIQPVRALDWA
jgi:hypothetical protein